MLRFHSLFSCPSILRTVRPGVAPSEQVVALALRECLPESIAGLRKTNPLAKIISENLDIDRAEGFRQLREEELLTLEILRINSKIEACRILNPKYPTSEIRKHNFTNTCILPSPATEES